MDFLHFNFFVRLSLIHMHHPPVSPPEKHAARLAGLQLAVWRGRHAALSFRGTCCAASRKASSAQGLRARVACLLQHHHQFEWPRLIRHEAEAVGAVAVVLYVYRTACPCGIQIQIYNQIDACITVRKSWACRCCVHFNCTACSYRVMADLSKICD